MYFCLLLALGMVFPYASAAGLTMFATCDNYMNLYADGNLLATSNNWERSTAVNIPSGTNKIQIDCKDVGGIGGILASSSKSLKTDNKWTCSSDNGQNWNPAYEIRNNDGWGHITTPVNGISTDAKWIWTGPAEWTGRKTSVSCKITLGECDSRGQWNRKDCGYFGIREYECLNKGCCWDSRIFPLEVKKCYAPAPLNNPSTQEERSLDIFQKIPLFIQILSWASGLRTGVKPMTRSGFSTLKEVD